jgi:hypothetical protein
MTPKSSSQTRQIGLRLTLGGAPTELHTVAGLSGFYRPDRPTPVGGEGEPTVEEAQAAVKAGAHLEIVELQDDEADELRALAAHDHERARGNTDQPSPAA